MTPRALRPVADPPSRRRFGRTSRDAGLSGALLHTLPGRAIVIGLAVKVVIALLAQVTGAVPSFLRVVDTVAGLATAAGATFFVFRLSVIAKRRLLWRVRRKLILSYIFIGFVPALLIVAFFLLCGYLLFFNFGSYLVQSRLRALSEQARFLAQSTAVEIQRASGLGVEDIIARRQTNAADQFPDLSIAVLPVRRECESANAAAITLPVSEQTAGPWAHVDAPRTVPAWIPCSGFSGVLTYVHQKATIAADEDAHLLVRGVAFPDAARPGYAVIVDLLVNDHVRQQLRQETGVELKNVVPLPAVKPADARPLRGRMGGDGEPRATIVTGLLSNLPTLMEYRDWSSGATGTVNITTGLSVSELYDRISAGEGIAGRGLGQGLLLLLFVIGALFLIIEFIALVAGFALAKSITGSVHELFAGTERVRQGDFTNRIAVKSEDQLGELAGSFNSMTASIEDLLQQAAEKKRLEEELRIAHEIQMSLLPQGPLLMPGLSVTALCVPAREVGGDYYDFLPLDEYRVGVLIADVSGKGTSAALYMAELKGLVLSLSEIHRSPRDLLIAANRIIAKHLDARSFITMTYAVIDMRARTMTYARAGHTPLIYVPGNGDSRRARILIPEGMVLGLKLDNGEMFERILEEETIQLNAGDLYLFFTDGISEAMNVHDDCFGEQRLGELVENHSHLPSDQLRERMLREIASFVGDAPQHDDMTMILLKVDEAGREGQDGQEGQEGKITPDPEFSLPARPALPAFPAR
jgi:sigma-B regulation protein RsbU (phosphoserine phosphatase)